MAAAAWDPKDPDVLHIKLPNKVTLEKVGAVLDQLEPMLRGQAAVAPIGRLLLDMSSTAFCSPTGITIVAAALEHLFLEGKVSVDV